MVGGRKPIKPEVPQAARSVSIIGWVTRRLLEPGAFHIRESDWQKSHFILSGNDAILIFSWSPNKFYHSLLGCQIKTVVKSCHQSERQRTNQKDKEPFVYKKELCKDWIYIIYLGRGHLVGKGGIKGGTFECRYLWKYNLAKICSLDKGVVNSWELYLI